MSQSRRRRLANPGTLIADPLRDTHQIAASTSGAVRSDRSSQEVLVNRINVLFVGLALLVSSPVGTAQESSADSGPRQSGAGVESDLHRHAHCDQYRELLESAARGDRSHGDLRCVQRHEAALHTNFRPQPGRPRRVAPSGSRRCGLHGAGRPVPVPTAGAGCQLCGVARGTERALRTRRPVGRTTAFVRRRASSAASPGESRSRRPCSPGARPMGSARAPPCVQRR